MRELRGREDQGREAVRLHGWAPGATEVMLKHEEVVHLADLPLFIRLLKYLKGTG